MKIVAFGHRKFVGKDTAAKLLLTELRLRNIPSQRVSFAVELKRLAFQLYHHLGLELPEYYESRPAEKDVVLPKLGRTPREVWIMLGNSCRAIYQDTWIDLAIKSQQTNVLIFTDLRFPNEAFKIKEAGGKCMKIVRDSAPISDDESDMALADYCCWDHVIENNGNIRELNTRLMKEVLPCCI